MYFEEIKKRIDAWVLERDSDLTLTEYIGLTEVLNAYKEGNIEGTKESVDNLKRLELEFQNNPESSLAGARYNYNEYRSRELEKIVDTLVSHWFDVSEIYSQLDSEFDAAMRRSFIADTDIDFEQRKSFWYPKSLLRGVSKERISFEQKRYSKDSFDIVLRQLNRKENLATPYMYYCLISGYIYWEYLQFTYEKQDSVTNWKYLILKWLGLIFFLCVFPKVGFVITALTLLWDFFNIRVSRRCKKAIFAMDRVNTILQSPKISISDLKLGLQETKADHVVWPTPVFALVEEFELKFGPIINSSQPEGIYFPKIRKAG